MSRSVERDAGRLLAAGLAGLALSGCITLLPKGKPIQMFRFGADVSAKPAAPASGPVFTVRASPIGFETAAATDRILTVEGDRTAYIATGRWVGTARGLFGAAVTRAFDVHGGPARLLAQGEPVTADYMLKLDVRTFEVRYPPGGAGAPKVDVEVYAALNDRKAATEGPSRLFQVEVPAAANSMRAIADAFDAAVGQVLGQIVGWVDAKGA